MLLPSKNMWRTLAASITMAYLTTMSLASAWQLTPSVSSTATASPGDVVDKLGDNLMVVYQDQKHHWWFGTWGDGLYRYDGKNILHFTTKHGLAHHRIEQILEDSVGNLFFSTPSGVCRFDGMKFTQLPERDSWEWKLAPGDLWLKSKSSNGKVLRYDGNILHSLQLPKIKIGEDYIAKFPSVLSPYDIYTIYRDKHANVWFGTAALGVCRYDGKSFDWLTSDDVNELHNGPSNGVRSMVEDHEGHFWFNTRYRYAIGSILDANNQSNPDGIFHRLPGIGSLDGKPDGEYEFLSISEDRNQTLWIATYRHGVFRYDGKQLKRYLITEGSETITLFTVYIDREDTIWIGTQSHGVYRFNGNTFERFIPTQAQ